LGKSKKIKSNYKSKRIKIKDNKQKANSKSQKSKEKQLSIRSLAPLCFGEGWGRGKIIYNKNNSPFVIET
jgi:hypothetical protein